MTESSKPPSGGRMKARAPLPPQVPQPAPRHIFRTTLAEGRGKSDTDAKENILKPTVDLQVTLPNGYQTSVTEDGSKALMDLLVELCSRFHLNPSLHTLELFSTEGHTLGFKPNILLGSLNVASVLIKAKVLEEKVVRRSAPKMPEKTVRLMLNYHGNQKAVVRVNPFVPLKSLLPIICEKCDFDPAHVLLLKDSISRHELQLNKSLTELEVKELYVHDQSLVLQPKMASAPALNHSDSIHSSTTSLGRTEKRGFLGIFPFSRLKTKTQTASIDMDDCDDKVTQNTDRQTNGLSSASRDFSTEDLPSTFSQSQSVTNIPRMSPKALPKKRKAPVLPGVPPPTTGHSKYQMGVGLKSQQRKRKAPVPPSTSASISPGPDDNSASVAPTSASNTKVSQSTTISVSTVVTETVKPAPLKRVVPPPTMCTATPSNTSQRSSSPDSLSAHDSSSELSHSLDDSDSNLDLASSRISSLTSSTVSDSVVVQPTLESSSNQVEKSEKSICMAAKLNEEVSSVSSSRPETELDLNLKLDEVENRHSTMVPPKPRRSPAQELQQHLFPSSLFSHPTEPTDSDFPQNLLEAEEVAPQSWLCSVQTTKAVDQKPVSVTPTDETMSLGSSSGSSTLPDQNYAASEETAEGEDSGMVSSLSDTQPTSPDGSLSLHGCSRGGERMLGPVQDNSSDSDEGCATWGSRHRRKDVKPQATLDAPKGNYEDNPELTAQLHQTLADFDADLANHIDAISIKSTSCTGSDEVPVSVVDVDVDVPVTTINEVMDFHYNIPESYSKSLTRTESSGSKGPGSSHHSSGEPQNKNNNAHTAIDTNKNSSANVTQLCQPKQIRANKSKGNKKEEKIGGKLTETSIADDKSVKKDKQEKTSTVKSNVDMQKHTKSTEIISNPMKSSIQESKPVVPPMSQRTVSTERHEDLHRVYLDNSSSTTLRRKIMSNATSRFGMKTFTVVPPKPAVSNTASEVPTAKLTLGAIKIDDYGNMVKEGIGHSEVGGSLKSSEIDDSEGSQLLGKAKAFWSSSERQQSALLHNKGLIDKAKLTTDGPKIPTPVASESTLNTSNTMDLKSSLNKHSERFQPKEIVKTGAKEPVKDVMIEVHELESKTSVSRHVQQQSNKPVLSPSIVPDLSFLKTTRRTSSQYMASAINKYTNNTSAKTTSIPNVSDSSVSLKTKTIGFQTQSRSVQGNPTKSSLSFLSHNKENKSALKLNPPGPKNPMTYSEKVSNTQKDFAEVRMYRGGFGTRGVSIKGSSNTLETEISKNKNIQSTQPTHINMAPSGHTDNMTHPRSPSSTASSPVHPSGKSSAAPKVLSQDQTSSMTDMAKAVTSLKTDEKVQPPFSETDTGVTPGVLPISVFGPVTKFRPVISRPVEEETSLHSSLMEAIQTGRGRDRLKKINAPGPSRVRKITYVEENQKSALLAAIRAQNYGRLQKTKSEAANELEKFRKASEEEGSAGPCSSPSITCTSPPVFTPPPQPLMQQTAMIVPPPPPVLPPSKAAAVAHPRVNTPMHPALAREAMMEAIRSGVAAERLKKVPLPTKSVRVNSRLGTIQPTSSAHPEQ